MNCIQMTCPNGKEIHFTAPSTWNELTREQLLFWAGICLQNISLRTAYTQTVNYFYQFPKKVFRLFNTGQVLQLADTLHFLKEENQLIHWLIPSFKYGFCRYYGPDDCLGNLTIAEYRRTELYYQAYVRTGTKRWLFLLVATLYRERRKGMIDDDIRQPLTEHGVLTRAGLFPRLSPLYLHAILLNYEGCRNHLMKQYARAFRSSDSAKSSTEIPDLEEVIEAIAGDKFGTFAQTEQTNLHRFFRHLVSTIERADQTNKR